MGNPYEYGPLETPRHTRLIKLRADREHDAALSCEIVTTCVDKPDPYVALSYTWGKETGKVPMKVLKPGAAPDDDSPVILVTPNCAAALKKLRASELIRGKGVWVDAICINQHPPKEDEKEKSDQVAMMAKIYEKAEVVAVWLGDGWAPECYDKVAATTVWYLNTVCRLPSGRGILGFLMGRVKHHVVRLALRGTDQKALRHMLEAPNWKRAWILQETTLESAVVLCKDSRYCPTFGLWNALRHHAPLHTEQYGLQLHIDLARARNTTLSSGHESAGEALKMIRQLLPVVAGDPRDKVYAFRGLLKNTLGKVAVDYTQTVATVFTTATQRYIEVHSDLDILYEAVRNPTKLSDLPSWALDWAVKDVNDLMLLPGLIMRYACASDRSEPYFQFSDRGMTIRLKGKKVGEVGRHAGRFCPTEGFTAAADSNRGLRLNADWNEGLRTLSEFILSEDTDNIISSTAQDQYRAFRRLLLRYVKGQPTLSFALSMFFDPHTDAAQALQRAQSAEGLDRGIPMHIAGALSGVMLVFTTEGRFALGYCAVQPGDLICVFAGLGMPFVVRPKGPSFTLVGYAYVDGVMDGELWPKDEDGLTRWEIV